MSYITLEEDDIVKLTPNRYFHGGSELLDNMKTCDFIFTVLEDSDEFNNGFKVQFEDRVWILTKDYYTIEKVKYGYELPEELFEV
jgi:hypothetical protein